jgi:hypothetical protein
LSLIIILTTGGSEEEKIVNLVCQQKGSEPKQWNQRRTTTVAFDGFGDAMRCDM